MRLAETRRIVASGKRNAHARRTEKEEREREESLGELTLRRLALDPPAWCTTSTIGANDDDFGASEAMMVHYLKAEKNGEVCGLSTLHLSL